MGIAMSCFVAMPMAVLIFALGLLPMWFVMGVVTTGRPCIHASTILPLMPAPNRSGASRTRDSSIAAATDSANPSTRNPSFGLCSCLTASVGYAP